MASAGSCLEAMAGGALSVRKDAALASPLFLAFLAGSG